MKNKAKKEIEQLRAKMVPLQEQIYELEKKEVEEFQIPRLSKLVGVHMRMDKEHYGKIIDLVYGKDGTPCFILEEIYLVSKVNPHIHLDNVYPYLNKEWWDSDIPMYGWERCSEKEYALFRSKVMNEFSTQKLLRKFVKKS